MHVSTGPRFVTTRLPPKCWETQSSPGNFIYIISNLHTCGIHVIIFSLVIPKLVPCHFRPGHGISTVHTNNLGLSRRMVRHTAQTSGQKRLQIHRKIVKNDSLFTTISGFLLVLSRLKCKPLLKTYVKQGYSKQRLKVEWCFEIPSPGTTKVLCQKILSRQETPNSVLEGVYVLNQNFDT